MTSYNRIRNTIMSNPDGVMDSIMSFSLISKVKSNVRLYFYMYNIYDLIEIEYVNGVITVFDFKHTEDKAIQIRDNLEFYAGYFKSAGLEGKRFLFDITLKLPVSYNDFIEMDDIPYPVNEEFAFILDKRSGYIYGRNNVYIFIASCRTSSIDKCVLSYINNSIMTKDNKQFELAGCMSSIVISGLLSGLQFQGIEEENKVVDVETKYIGTIRDLELNSQFINNIFNKLKIDKFKRILKSNVIEAEVIEKVELKGEVSLRDIVDQGLDRYIKSIKNPKDVIKVIIDCEYQTIRSAYIVKGELFITPVTLMPVSYFRELLNSDNVQYVLN